MELPIVADIVCVCVCVCVCDCVCACVRVRARVCVCVPVDALWVGLPVVTNPGERMAARVSASLLAAAGLTLFITRSLEDYQALAYALIRRPAKLREARRLTVAYGRGGGGGAEGGGVGSAGGREGVFEVAAWVRRFEGALRLSWEVYLARGATGGGSAREAGGGGVARFPHVVVSSGYVAQRASQREGLREKRERDSSKQGLHTGSALTSAK